jgi:hypothetical protein
MVKEKQHKFVGKSLVVYLLLGKGNRLHLQNAKSSKDQIVGDVRKRLFPL